MSLQRFLDLYAASWFDWSVKAAAMAVIEDGDIQLIYCNSERARYGDWLHLSEATDSGVVFG